MKNQALKNFVTGGTSAMLVVRFLTMLALLLAFNVITVSASNDGCSNATLQGDYGATISGYFSNPNGTTTPLKGVAVTHFDGAGKLTQRDFVVDGGTPQPSNGDAQTGFHFSTGETGTYSLNPDCTGSAEIDLNVPVPFGSHGVLKLMFVVTNGGRAIHAVVAELTPPGATTPVLVTTTSDAWKIGSELD